jgi:hypothetical protein
VISNLGDDIANTQITLSQTLGELAVTDLSANITLQQGFHNGIPKTGVNLSVRVFLQGAYDENTGLLTDDLRAQSFIPTTSPYIDALQITDANVLNATGSNAIVDWVFVEVRDRNLSELVLAEQSALLQRDGDVVGLDGLSPLAFDLFPGEYFLSVSHRNHLGVISNTAEVLSKDSFVLDFTNGNVAAKGGINGRWQFGDGALAMIAGNASGDNRVNLLGANNDRLTLRNAILNDPGNFFGTVGYNISGYSNFDVNMDGSALIIGENNDSLYILNIIRTAEGNFFGTPGFTFTQQF